MNQISPTELLKAFTDKVAEGRQANAIATAAPTSFDGAAGNFGAALQLTKSALYGERGRMPMTLPHADSPLLSKAHAYSGAFVGPDDETFERAHTEMHEVLVGDSYPLYDREIGELPAFYVKAYQKLMKSGGAIAKTADWLIPKPHDPAFDAATAALRESRSVPAASEVFASPATAANARDAQSNIGPRPGSPRSPDTTGVISAVDDPQGAHSALSAIRALLAAGPRPLPSRVVGFDLEGS